MGIKTYNPYTPSRRNMTGSDFSEITKSTPEKSLLVSLSKNSGRNNQGKITHLMSGFLHYKSECSSSCLSHFVSMIRHSTGLQYSLWMP